MMIVKDPNVVRDFPVDVLRAMAEDRSGTKERRFCPMQFHFPPPPALSPLAAPGL